MSAASAPSKAALPGRILAIILALAFAFLAYLVWQNAQETKSAMQLPDPAALVEQGTPAAVEQCIADRIAQIDQWASSGLMDEASADLSRARARTYCVQTN